ncbi:LEAF RUST 10 DISEASE-RESISTANCE LOCUS RECEPTOR-LIKE PROTEIN KINASE-like 2.4 [Curcuma longa]|uniref:LEAF RUST 10 DISEASE-RESISTANCE LOCUS RECEPTOR-LIKE PROTEIN KINASE-like 2.4 n=1 Tax=Curcuma longa TaxID=136217 RepID=UPI003D9DE258
MAGAAVSFLLLAFLVLSCLLVLFPIPSCGDYSCPTSLSSSCSNVNVSYPFWLSHDPNQTNSYCGHQSFMLSCQDHIPILRLGDHSYRVLNINYADRVISLSDDDIFFHAPEYSCFRVWRNVSLGSNTRFAYAYTNVNLTFFFNCTDTYSGWSNNMIRCLRYGGPKGNLSSYVFSEISNDNSLPRNCAGVVVSPVLQSHVFDLSANLLVDRYAGILQTGFELQWTGDNAGANCADCERSGGRCGYNTIGDETLASAACFCPDGTIGVSPCGRRRKQYKGWMIGDVIWVIVGVIIACLFLIYLRHFRKQGERKDQAIQDFILQYESTIPKRYNYTEIKRMTKSFSDKLGEGGCGSVFKGSLRDGCLVAVKILSETKGNGEEFINEVASISRTSHVNIVALLGFCLEGSKRALVYEFMSNGSLDKFIFSKNSIMEDNKLSWEKLYDIAIGIARGLEYLHRGCKTRIVHFDIKPHNILLDQNFCPKISDFGLAKLCLRKGSIISTIAMRGTPGYIAPELFSRSFGTISSKSDVYSYGMMVLEMVGGRKNYNNARVADTTSENYFPHWVYDNLDKYCNLKISGMSYETEEIARKMIVVGLWCIQTKPENRPSIGMVVGMLEGDIRALQMPPKPELY